MFLKWSEKMVSTQQWQKIIPAAMLKENSQARADTNEKGKGGGCGRLRNPMRVREYSKA